MHHEAIRSLKLLPIRVNLHEAIAQTHYKAKVWNQDQVPHPQFPPATGYGWKTEGDRLVPITSMDPPAPAPITHLVKCGWKKS